MAQTGYTPILIYSSSTTTNAPAAGSLTNSTLGSELAINIADGKLFYKDNANAVQVIAWKTTPTTAGGTGLTSYTAGDLLYYATGTTLTKLAIGSNKTILTSSGTAPQWSASLDTTQGGTGVTSYTAGDLVYYATGTTFTKLAIGANTTILTSSGTAPQWTTASSVTIGTATNLAGGAQGSIPYQSGAATTVFLAKDTNATRYLANTGTSNNPAWAQIDLTNGVTGTLPVGNGGTGNTTGAATAVKSNATTGLMEIVGPGASTTRVMTIPNADFTAARTDANQTFTGTQTVQAASTQDSVALAGRAGGTSSYVATITPTTLSASRTITLPDNSGTVITTASAASTVPGNGALTEADQWRVTANVNIAATVTDITANWERSDNTGAGYLGTGMSQSSGIFTFPSTGIWYIRFYGNASIDGSNRFNVLSIYTTTNNSTYSVAAYGYAFVSRVNSNFTLNYCSADYIFNVTDTTNYKIKFSQYGESAQGVWNGDTTANALGVIFIRLGA